MAASDRLMTKSGVKYYGTNQQTTDVEYIYENEEHLPTAPPIASMERVSGYDDMQFDECKSIL